MRKTYAFVTCLCIIVAGLLLSRPTPAAAQGFGVTYKHATTVNWTAFKPINEDSAYVGSHSNGSVYSDEASDPYLYAPIGMGDLPNGVMLTDMSVYFYDSSSSTNENITVELCRSWVDTADGTDPGAECFVTVEHLSDSTDSSTNCDHVESVGFCTDTNPEMCDYPSTSTPPETILYQWDVDNDETMETVNYYLRVTFGVTGGNNKLRQVRFLWKRQFSDPPDCGDETFADVDCTDFGYKHIEALAASGVTVGTGGNYDPTGSVTRAQMAVFIAKALGLHFDASN